MRVGIATDHGGFGLKEELVARLRDSGHEVVDFGAFSSDPRDDYPDYVLPLARAVVAGKVERGVAICGSGVGASVCANKVSGIRACLIHDHFSAQQGVEDDHMNILCMGGANRGTRRCLGSRGRFPGGAVQQCRATPSATGKSFCPRSTRKEAVMNDHILQTAVNTIRTLSIDAVQAAKSGHPGTPMALAPLLYTIWNRAMYFDPQDTIWPNRDRFVLSNGHASMLLWSILHLTQTQAVDADYESLGHAAVSLDDIRRFRQIDSRAPGHPEYRWVSGVETTTGPLGQGVATSVGMAMPRNGSRTATTSPALRCSTTISTPSAVTVA